MMEEIWKPVTGKAAWLEVSNLGRVRSLPTARAGMRAGKIQVQQRPGTMYSPFVGHHGYKMVAPKFGQSRPKMLVHRLVAMEFVPGYFEGACVNHIDGDKSNNRFDNLEWTTLAENTRHQWRAGLVDLRGENHPSAKITDAQAREILARRAAGERVADLANEFGVSQALIYKIQAGKKRAGAF